MVWTVVNVILHGLYLVVFILRGKIFYYACKDIKVFWNGVFFFKKIKQSEKLLCVFQTAVRCICMGKLLKSNCIIDVYDIGRVYISVVVSIEVVGMYFAVISCNDVVVDCHGVSGVYGSIVVDVGAPAWWEYAVFNGSHCNSVSYVLVQAEKLFVGFDRLSWYVGIYVPCVVKGVAVADGWRG